MKSAKRKLKITGQKLSKAQKIKSLKLKNLKGGNSCPPPIEDN